MTQDTTSPVHALINRLHEPATNGDPLVREAQRLAAVLGALSTLTTGTPTWRRLHHASQRAHDRLMRRSIKGTCIVCGAPATRAIPVDHHTWLHTCAAHASEVQR